MTEKSSYIAYIDESGDDGFSENSSKWFVVSAFIVRASRDSELVSLKKEILTKINSKKISLHMKDIKGHDKKCYISKKLSNFPARYISVLSNKANITKEDFTKTTNAYYWFLSKLLLERITKCCSDLRKDTPEGNGKIKIIFSNRGGMKYQDFKDYLSVLKQKDKDSSNPRINWNLIDIDTIQSINHSERVGLQFADVVAYANFKGVEKHRDFQTISLDLVKELKNNTHQKNKVYIGYGIKFMPKYEDIQEKPEEYYELYNKK